MTHSKVLALGFLLALVAGLTTTGCLGIKPDDIIKHPDAPMLIQETKRGYLKIAVYSKDVNGMVSCGWIKSEEVKGWTLHKFDWEAYILKQKSEGGIQ